MKIRHLAIGSAVVAAAFSLSLAFAQPGARSTEPVASTPAIAATEYEVDGVHSSVIFRIMHNGVCPFYGAFKQIHGTFTLGDDASAAAFDVAIKTESIDTRNGNRDGHLKGDEFFDASKHKEITFKSTGAESTTDGLKVNGDLTLRGVTKPVTATMKVWPGRDTSQGFKAGIEAIFTIKRSDFGMDAYVANGGLGDEVTITVACEGKKK